MTIGQRIRARRRAKRFSQEYLAEQVGVSRQAVSKWEADQTAPDMKNMVALAALLEVSLDWLANGEQSQPPLVPARLPKALQKLAWGLCGLALLLYLGGLLGGVFNRHAGIPVSGGVVHIPLLYYGTSSAAVALLASAVLSLACAALLGLVARLIRQEQTK